MQFNETKTYKNLARSFAGECQAGMRYQLAAQMATQQGYTCLADTIKTIAKNETVHARRFFEEINKHGLKLDNVEFDAGYPFHSGTLAECLRFAALDEQEEHQRIYPVFAQEAKEEGFEDIAALYSMIAVVEKRHQAIFEYLHKAFTNGTLYQSPKPTLYICSECGHVYIGEKAWDICPLCKSSQGFVELHLPE